MKRKILLTILTSLYLNMFAKTWKVGPNKTYTYCSQVAALVADGDTIEIDFATYQNDAQVKWSKNNLYITGVGGRPRLEAGAIIANDANNGKGIFVTAGANIKIHNIEFANAKVQSNNGAGIRQEGVNLLITHCKFDGNEMGVLSGNIANCKTVIEYCEFLNGGSIANLGYQHNIYINHIDTFIFRYNYTYDALAEGHELKSRANCNFILYNRISNINNIDSRNIDIPNGGTTVIMGNIIEQGTNSSNSNILGYGLEGLTNVSKHNLWICNNTFVNKKSTGSFINIATNTDTLFIKNNIFAGAKTGGFIIGTANFLDSSNNLIDNTINNIGFLNSGNYDYNLTANSAAINMGIAINKSILGYKLSPNYMYKDICNFETRNNNGALDIGAYEFKNVNSAYNINITNILSIYPNPCSNYIYLSKNEIYQVYNTNGTLLLNGFGSLIQLEEINSGNYILVTTSGKYKFTKN